MPLLALFSFSVVAGASGFGAKPDYAKAVRDVAPAKAAVGHGDEGKAKADEGKARVADGVKAGGEVEKGAYVVVDASKHDDRGTLASLTKRFTGREVCWITQSQLTRVSQSYATGRIDIRVGGGSLSIVTVRGASDHDLRTLLGTPEMKCQLVQVAHIFFLPFDAHGS